MKKENARTAGSIPATGTIRSRPTAQVIIKGLPLLCFSERNNRAELGFLDVVNHDLLVWVNKDKHKEPIEVSKGSTIEINPKNPGIGEVFRKPNDDHDFGLVVDLNKHHAGAVKVKKSYKFYAKMYINNATFYTKEKSVFDAELKQIGGTERKELKKVGKVAGANIYDKDVEILMDGAPLDLSGYEKPYEITVLYQCPVKSTSRTSDFKHVYKAVETADAKTYDLLYKGDEPTQISGAELKGIVDLLKKTQILLSANEKKAAALDRNKILAELNYIQSILSCEVACQVITLGGETNEI